MCNISNLITLIISIYWDALCDACQICGKVKESLYNHNDAGTNLEGQRWDCVFTQIFFGISLPFVFFMLDWHLDIWARIGEKHIALEKVVVEQNLCVQWQWVTTCIFLLYNMLEFWGRLPFQNPCICEMPFQHGNTKHTLYCIIRLFQLIFSTFYSSSKTLIKTLYH